MRGVFGKKAERRAAVFRVRETKKTGNNLDVAIKRDAGRGQVFRPMVEQDDDEC